MERKSGESPDHGPAQVFEGSGGSPSPGPDASRTLAAEGGPLAGVLVPGECEHASKGPVGLLPGNGRPEADGAALSTVGPFPPPPRTLIEFLLAGDEAGKRRDGR